MLEDTPVCSCLVLGVEAEGKSINTIEGMAQGDSLHPLQRKFIEHASLQCGICTPGFLVAAKALLDRNPNPTGTRIRPSPRSGTGWPGTCATAPDMTRLS